MGQDSSIPYVRLDGETFKPRLSNSRQNRLPAGPIRLGASERGDCGIQFRGQDGVNPCRKGYHAGAVWGP